MYLCTAFGAGSDLHLIFDSYQEQEAGVQMFQHIVTYCPIVTSDCLTLEFGS